MRRKRSTAVETVSLLLVVLQIAVQNGGCDIRPATDMKNGYPIVVQAYAPNHPLHPLHPMLTTKTAVTTTTNTGNAPPPTNTPSTTPATRKTHTKRSLPKHRPNDAFLSQPPLQTITSSPMNIATATATKSSTSSVRPSTFNLATPTVDQLELHQLLQRPRHNPTTNTAGVYQVKTTATEEDEYDDDEEEEHDDDENTPTTTTNTLANTHNKKKKIQRKRSGVITASSTTSSSSTKSGRNPTGNSSQNHSKKNQNYAPLLTAAEEMEYSYRIRTLRAALRIREQMVTLQDGIHIHPTEQQWCIACGCTTLKQLRRLIQEGQAAKTQLISSNTGLVVQYAKKQYANLKQAMEAGGGVGTILTLSDMIQEGHFGLIEAAERYQPEKGFRFSTYATYWVKQRILRCISDSSRTIRLPVHVHETLYKIKKAKRTLYSTLGREPTITEIAQSLEISEDRIRSYTASSRNVISLERPLSGTVSSTSSSGGGGKSSSSSSSSSANGGGSHGPSSSIGSITGTTGGSTGGGSGGGSKSSGGGSSMNEDTRTLLDTIASDGPTPEEDAVLDSMRRDIRAVLDTELAGLEQQVVRYRFGLVYDDDDNKNEHEYDNLNDRRNTNHDDDDDGMMHRHRRLLNNHTIACGESYSVRETSQILQISMDRVRLLEARALNKLRHPMRNYKLKDYVQGLGMSITTSMSSSTSRSSASSSTQKTSSSSSSSSSMGSSSSTSRLRPKATPTPTTVQPLSPLQQWLSFQHSEYTGMDTEVEEDTNNPICSSNTAMTKSRLEEAYANSPSSYTSVVGSSGKSTTASDRLWFF